MIDFLRELGYLTSKHSAYRLMDVLTEKECYQNIIDIHKSTIPIAIIIGIIAGIKIYKGYISLKSNR